MGCTVHAGVELYGGTAAESMRGHVCSVSEVMLRCGVICLLFVDFFAFIYLCSFILWQIKYLIGWSKRKTNQVKKGEHGQLFWHGSRWIASFSSSSLSASSPASSTASAWALSSCSIRKIQNKWNDAKENSNMLHPTLYNKFDDLKNPDHTYVAEAYWAIYLLNGLFSKKKFKKAKSWLKSSKNSQCTHREMMIIHFRRFQDLCRRADFFFAG